MAYWGLNKNLIRQRTFRQNHVIMITWKRFGHFKIGWAISVVKNTLCIKLLRMIPN